jgi:hypothetical protein
MGISYDAANLGVIAIIFQWRLHALIPIWRIIAHPGLFHRQIDRIQQACCPQIIDAGQLPAAREAEMAEEVWRGRIDEWPTWRFTPPCGANPASFHQHIECSPCDLNAPNRLNLRPAHWLVICNDGQCLDGRTTEPTRLLLLPPKNMAEIAGRLEVPSATALHQLDTSPGILIRQQGQMRQYRALNPAMPPYFSRRHRLFGGK